jgi:hypothetical protein
LSVSRPVIVTGYVTRNLEGSFTFKLGDGARFNMKTQIVWHTYQHGTTYWQFPTTFHDAVKADGSPVKGACEATLKKEL